ncbi:MAG: hypothetical protein IPL95_06660 [Saprospiraceae bacterium]|nr:hypothetical protein [Saprospiraceae bacterium]
MKLNFIYILIFAVTSSQCNREQDTKYQEQILGEWHIGCSDSLMTKYFSNVFETRNCGFSLEKDGKCTFLPGFIQLLDQNWKKDRFHSFGNISTYRLKNDSLSIFDLRTKSWQSAFIERLEKDTLILNFEKKKLKFYKKHESTHLNKLQFDEIILTSYNRGTIGPEFNILINENGSILFSGQDYTNIQGLYSSKNNKMAFKNLRTLINDINFEHINLENHIETTHEYSRNLLLIKDKKVVKS